MRRIIVLDEKNMAKFRDLIFPGVYAALLRPDTFAYGAEQDGSPVGAIVCKIKNLAAEIISLWVGIPFRRKGFATAMLNALCCDCASCLVGRVKIRYVLEQAPLKAMDALLEKFGFSSLETGDEYYTVTVGELCKNNFFRSATKELSQTYETPPIVQFQRLPNIYISEMFNRFGTEIPNLMSGAYERHALLNDLSMAYVRDGMILGAVIFTGEKDSPELSMAFTLPAARGKLPFLLMASMRVAAAKYKPDTPLRFVAVSRESRSLIALLLDGHGMCSMAEHIASKALI